MPFKNGTIVPNATVWTDEMIRFLKDNFFQMTNPQLAKALNLRLTVTRNKCRELGLKRIEMQYWTPEQIDYLKQNFTTKGDVEIAEFFQKNFAKNKPWTKQHICKKRKYLKLVRTKEQIFKIASANAKTGGNSCTIAGNSSSINLHPTWVAQRLAWRDKDLQQEILKHPDLIATGTQLYQLKRKIKQATNDLN